MSEVLLDATHDIAPSCEVPAASAQPGPVRSSKASAIVLRFFPCLTDLAFLVPIIGLYIFMEGAKTLLGDGDTGWHIRTGDWILQHGQVPYQDLFSFSKPGKPWFAWEWGWDVLFSAIHSQWALSGVVFFNILMLGLMGVLLYRLVRRQAPNDTVALLLTAVALCVTSLHWLARPHLLSWLFILVVLHLIERAEAGHYRWLWWTPPLTLLWVNLHGSFFIGIFFLCTYGCMNALQDIVLRKNGSSWWQAVYRQRGYFLCALACLAVSLLNPYGWRLHEHVVQYLSDAKQLNGISEFASLDFHSPLASRFELFLVLGVWVALGSIGKGQWGRAATILIWGHFALASARNIPIYIFIATPASAGLLKSGLEWMQRHAALSWLRKLAGGISSIGQDFNAFERVERVPLIPVAALLFFAVALGVVPAGRRRIVDFDSKDFPVAAAAHITPHSRVFTFDQWGDYLIYRSFPKERVFVDGRSDFYGAEFSNKWIRAMNAKHDWNDELSAFAIDTVLIRSEDPLSTVLKGSSQWKPVFDNGNSILFRKRMPLDVRSGTGSK